MNKIVFSHLAYILWFLFYFLLFWLLCGANVTSFLIVGAVYAMSILVAFSPIAENLWGMVLGLRPLRLQQEKTRLKPLFFEVYFQAIITNPRISKRVHLYIQEDMNINAFAFGRSTLVLTRGSIELLDDDCLKGLIAHELGHFSHYDTMATLLATIGNFFMSLLMKALYGVKKKTEDSDKSSLITIGFKTIYDLIFGVFRSVEFLGEVILMSSSRKQEYIADSFALKCGFGRELNEALLKIYEISISKPKSIREQIKSTHPPITMRIEKLEEVLYEA